VVLEVPAPQEVTAEAAGQDKEVMRSGYATTQTFGLNFGM
jgi:hypothetical protein